MNFSQNYNSIVNKKTRKNIRTQIIEVTGISYAGLRNWIKGITPVPQRYRLSIAKIMGIPVAELFPETDNCSAETNT